MKKNKKFFLISSILLIIFIFLLNIYNLFSYKSTNKLSTKNIDSNITKLTQTFNHNLMEVEKEILIKRTHPILGDIVSINFKENFRNFVFIGDSQVEGLKVYDILYASSVIAFKGANLVSSNAKSLPLLKGIAPLNIHLLYGMNDMLIYNQNIDLFVNDYKTFINNIKSIHPNSIITVNAIFPVSPETVKRQPIFNQINQYNEALKNMCNELKIEFLDSSQILINDSNLFESDGIHFKPMFYKNWLYNILQNS